MIRLLAVLWAVGALLLYVAADASAQTHLLALQPSGVENIEVKSLASGKHSSSFLIFIRETLPNHIHQHHS